MERSVFNKIVGIVREMSAQGVTRMDIETNLKQMGLTEDEIEDILAEAKPEVNVAEVHEKADATQKLLESGDHLKPAIDKLDEHKEDLERIHTNLGEMHEKQTLNAKDLQEIKEDIAEIKRDLAEIKPIIGAVQRLDESLVKINKRMLTRLGGQ